MLPVVTILVVTIVVSVSPVLVLVIIVASSVATVMEIVVVESLLLLLIAVVLIVVLVVLQVMLKTLLQLLLICQTRRITELLLLLLLMHLSRLLLLTLLLLLVYLLLLSLLSVSHAGVVEVMHGRVDVTHVTPVHGHSLGLVMHRRPRSSKHHLSLEISQRLHARHCGRGEGGSVTSLLLLELWRLLLTHELRLTRLLMLLTSPRHELRLLGWGQFGQRHDGGVLELTRGGARAEVGRGQQGKLLGMTRLLRGHQARLLLDDRLGRQLVMVDNLLLLLGEVMRLTHGLTPHLTPGCLHSEGGGGEAASLQGQLIHPLDHGVTPLAPVEPRPGLEAVLQLPAELLAVGGEVEEVLALLERHPLLLGELGELLMRVLPPLVTETRSAESVIVESVQVVLGTTIALNAPN